MNSLLNIQDPKHRFSIIGDTGKGDLEIKGVFLPEKIGALFIPVFDWIQNLPNTLSNKNFTVVFKIVFANTPVGHMFRHILLILNDLARKHDFNINVYWLYEEKDIKHENEGEALKAEYSHNISIKLVEVDKMENVM